MTNSKRYTGPVTLREGLDESQAMLIALARSRRQEYNVDPEAGPIGIAPDPGVGEAAKRDPARGYCTHAVPALLTRTAGEYLVEVTDEVAALEATLERLPNGTDVGVVRVGSVRDADTWPVEEEAAEVPLTR